MIRINIVAFLMMFAFLLAPGSSFAQERAQKAKTKTYNAELNLYDTLNIQDSIGHLQMSPEEARALPSLFFTKWQHALLLEARAGYENPRPVAAGEGNIVRGIRELSLGGIVFSSKEDWVIWLNGGRVTPDAIPKEVLDLRVSNNYIELKWFDAFTNQIFPVRLKIHQRFNIDSRIFLPGAGVR